MNIDEGMVCIDNFPKVIAASLVTADKYWNYQSETERIQPLTLLLNTMLTNMQCTRDYPYCTGIPILVALCHTVEPR